jgi:hypothetical protein
MKDEVTSEYFKWKDSIWNCEYAIRYPNSYGKKSTVLFSLLKKKDGSIERLNYIKSRIYIYIKEYCRLIKKLPIYKKLLNMLKNGTNLCIFETDVPAFGKKNLFGKSINDDGTYDITLEKIKKLLYDESEPFEQSLCDKCCCMDYVFVMHY